MLLKYNLLLYFEYIHIFFVFFSFLETALLKKTIIMNCFFSCAYKYESNQFVIFFLVFCLFVYTLRKQSANKYFTLGYKHFKINVHILIEYLLVIWLIELFIPLCCFLRFFNTKMLLMCNLKRT